MLKTKIRTIRELVDAMGGTKECAEWLGVTDSYVSNMLARGYLPGGFHMRAYVELRRRGFLPEPELFDLNGDEGELLRKLDSSRVLLSRCGPTVLA